jgi:hypothetical protein
MSEAMPDTYDRLMGALDGLPDVVHTRPSTVRTTVPILNNSQTYIIQSFRQVGVGDTIFLEMVSRDGSLRVALPPKVADAIARQRDALTAKSRSKAAKALAEERKERGEVPGFLRVAGKD